MKVLSFNPSFVQHFGCKPRNLTNNNFKSKAETTKKIFFLVCTSHFDRQGTTNKQTDHKYTIR